MDYKISYQNTHKHFIDIEFLIECITEDVIQLQLPAWRPGRYELSNYSRNIQKFAITALDNTPLLFKKIKKETWEVATNGLTSIKVNYNYYVAQPDAGGSWLDDDLLYINFINCLIYVLGREYEECKIKLEIPNHYQIACGLDKTGSLLIAKDYYAVADSPMLASPSLKHKSYEVNGYTFNVWLYGDCQPDWNIILENFKKFTQEQLDMMSDFPEKDYHFLFQILPQKMHHGVEHRNSTSIILGPADHINTKAFLNELFSISCHELYHAWNIIKIRPVEMMPYDLTKENYFQTGFVAEGITTYYGEFLLTRAGVLSEEEYFTELNGTLKKYFENYGRYNLSVADSSFDLWVDGYVPGIPNRKVSIYVKGALIALIFDIEIRRGTRNAKSLDDVMIYLYNEFAKKGRGYSIDDIRIAFETIANASFKELYEELVFGISPIENRLESAFNYLGCELEITDAKTSVERTWGLKLTNKDGKVIVDYTEPDSPADKVLAKDDELIAIDGIKINGNLNDSVGEKKQLTVNLFRRNKLLTITLIADDKTYLKNYKIAKRKNVSEQQKENFQKWIKKPF